MELCLPNKITGFPKIIASRPAVPTIVATALDFLIISIPDSAKSTITTFLNLLI